MRCPRMHVFVLTNYTYLGTAFKLSFIAGVGVKGFLGLYPQQAL